MKKEKVFFDHKRAYKQKKNLAYLVLAGITLIVWLALLIVKIVVAVENGDTILEVVSTVRDGIFDNILGILPPILLFDFGLQYLQQDKIFDEMTEQITGTIMSNPEVIQAFDTDAKKRFLNSTVLTLVDQNLDECAMAMGAIQPYIDNKYDIKKQFNYFIEIRECEDYSSFDKDKYMLIVERLSYEVYYIASKPVENHVHIGFFVENRELDKQLREQKSNEEDSRFIMREGLNIDSEDLNAFLQRKSETEIKNSVQALINPELYIDDTKWYIFDIVVGNNGIDIEFACEKPRKTDDGAKSKITLFFQMPQLKKNSSFLASISQPTYSPEIHLSYSAKKYDVKMFPFFNNTVGASVEQAEQGTGHCDIEIHDKWVHPMSGVVFFIDSKG